jgi:hypothetical protein
MRSIVELTNKQIAEVIVVLTGKTLEDTSKIAGCVSSLLTLVALMAPDKADEVSNEVYKVLDSIARDIDGELKASAGSKND